jgi:DNA-binding MurR/RpiR family transcriptional regulator
MNPRNPTSLARDNRRSTRNSCNRACGASGRQIAKRGRRGLAGGNDEEPMKIIPFPKAADSSLSEVVQEAFEAESRALKEVFQNLEISRFEEAVTALVIARRIYCYGVADSGVLASEAERRFVDVGLNCVGIQNPIQMAIQTSLLTPKDVVVGFGFTGKSRSDLEGLQLAYDAGATTICIASRSATPQLTFTDIPLILSSGRRSASVEASARTTELALIKALASCVGIQLRDFSIASSHRDEMEEALAVRFG